MGSWEDERIGGWEAEKKEAGNLGSWDDEKGIEQRLLNSEVGMRKWESD